MRVMSVDSSGKSETDKNCFLSEHFMLLVPNQMVFLLLRTGQFLMKDLIGARPFKWMELV